MESRRAMRCACVLTSKRALDHVIFGFVSWSRAISSAWETVAVARGVHDDLNLGVGNVLAELLRQLGFGLCRSEPGDAARAGERGGIGAVGQHHEPLGSASSSRPRRTGCRPGGECTAHRHPGRCGKGSDKQSNESQATEYARFLNGPPAQTDRGRAGALPKHRSRGYLQAAASSSQARRSRAAKHSFLRVCHRQFARRAGAGGRGGAAVSGQPLRPGRPARRHPCR